MRNPVRPPYSTMSQQRDRNNMKPVSLTYSPDLYSLVLYSSWRVGSQQPPRLVHEIHYVGGERDAVAADVGAGLGGHVREENLVPGPVVLASNQSTAQSDAIRQTLRRYGEIRREREREREIEREREGEQ